MTETGAEAERALRDRSIAEGAALFRHHGDAASAMLTAMIHDPSISADERRRHRLARTEVERLDRERRREVRPNAIAVWRPSLFSWAGLKAMFGIKRPRSGRRRR